MQCRFAPLPLLIVMEMDMAGKITIPVLFKMMPATITIRRLSLLMATVPRFALLVWQTRTMMDGAGRTIARVSSPRPRDR